MKRRIIVSILTALLFTAAAAVSFAEPVVIKGSQEETGENGADQQAAVRDRSLQDGTLIYGMTPVYPEDLKEGTYDVSAITSSRFMKITDAELINVNGRMSAVITLSSTSYAYVFQGSAAEAAAADSSEWIPADESTGYGRFGLEVEALNKEMPCAAYSKKKQKWYDRDIVFEASSLPEGAVLIDLSGEGGTITDTQEAALKVIYIALAIIVIGGILNHFVKKKYYE